jgi:hypothetical protein
LAVTEHQVLHHTRRFAPELVSVSHRERLAGHRVGVSR